MILFLYLAAVLGLARSTQKLLEIDCSESACEAECTLCSLHYSSLEDCLRKLPQGCSVVATISQNDVSPLYTCVRPHVGRGIALPYLTLDAKTSLAVVKIDRFRPCSAPLGSVRGGALSKQEMKTCALSSADAEILPQTGGDATYVDVSHSMMKSKDMEFVKILDPCVHEQDKISISLLIETGGLQGLGTESQKAPRNAQHVIYSCPALGVPGAFAAANVCMKPLEYKLERPRSPRAAGLVIAGIPMATVFLRIRQVFVLLLGCAMAYISQLYYRALRKEMARSRAAKEVVRDSFHQKEKNF